MSWKRSQGSIVLRDTTRGKSGYQRDFRDLSRKSSYGKSIRKNVKGEKKTEEPPSEEEPPFQEWAGLVYKKLVYNRTFRIRVVYSLCLVWIYMILGFNAGQLGPMLLDLALITGVNLTAASNYIIIIGVGYIAGSFLGGLVYERVSRPMILCVVSLVLAILEISIPYCRVYWLMMIVLLLDSACEGLIDTVANTEMVSLWGRSVASWMQGMYFMFAVGAIISPLVTAPFLAPKLDVAVNVTGGEIISLSYYDSRQSRIYLVFIINAVLALIATLLFFYQCFLNARYLHGLSLPINDNHQMRPLCMSERFAVLLNIGLMCLVYTAIEATFAEYLTIFCVSQMGMTKIYGSEATSLFYATFGMFRFLGILLVTEMNPISLVCVYLVILILSLVGMALSGAFVHVIGIWLFAPLVGIGLSIIYPILYTWTDEQFLPITGKISAYLVISASIGRMINPAILGHLMQFKSPMWYCYLLLIEALIFLLLYDIGLILSRWISSKPSLQRLYIYDVELDPMHQKQGKVDTGLEATVRLSSTTISTKSKQSEQAKMQTITEDKPGTSGLSAPDVTSEEKDMTSEGRDMTSEHTNDQTTTAAATDETQKAEQVNKEENAVGKATADVSKTDENVSQDSQTETHPESDSATPTAEPGSSDTDLLVESRTEETEST